MRLIGLPFSTNKVTLFAEVLFSKHFRKRLIIGISGESAQYPEYNENMYTFFLKNYKPAIFSKFIFSYSASKIPTTPLLLAVISRSDDSA